ncbi:unnamed protein product [Heterosigma akashiwo]
MKVDTHLAPLAGALRSSQLSLTSYLEQLEIDFALNERILAFLPEEGRFQRLQREAVELEARYPDPESRPPLYGIPFGVKDIFHADGFCTQAGSRLPSELLTGPEAETVALLKQAGALMMGKTVTTEFAYVGPGPTRNPHNLEHTPGGSSSGSAAAVAAGLCPLALGSQTVGSIIRPASFCGTVGFKPTFGRISSLGVIPSSISLDHIGFFTQDVAGAIEAAAVLCADWDETSVCDNGLPILGVPAGPYLEKASPEGLEHFQATQEKLKQAGYEIRVVQALPDFDEVFTLHNNLVASEVAIFHEYWFGQYGDLYHPQTAALIERGRQISLESANACRAKREQLRSELLILMAEHGVSAWIAPSSVGPAPVGLESTGNPVMNSPWTYSGLPAISVPSGLAKNGLPIGLQIVSCWQQDEQLMVWAKDIVGALNN